jgi:predicted Zn-dependent protease
MASGSPWEKLFKEAKKQLAEGIDGDKKAVRGANEKLHRLREADPGDALVLAYYGSSLTLLARDAVKLMEKEEKANEGLDALNRAVQLEPNHKEIRLLRANVCLRLPDDYFGTLAVAIEDFTYLLDRQSENAGYLAPKQAKDVASKLAEAYLEAGMPAKAQETKQRYFK